MQKKLIENGYVITVDEQFRIFPDGAVYIEDDKILDIGECQALRAKYQDAKKIDAEGMVVMPGLINTHIHSGLIRGTAEDLPLWEWLSKHVDPMHRALTADIAYAASRLSYTESILAGTTCVMDMYRFMHRSADAAEELGIRAVLVPYVADKAGYDYFESIEDNVRLIESHQGAANGRIQVWMGLEHMVYATEQTYHKIADLAARYDVGIHTHGEESLEMSQLVRQKYGRSTVEVFLDRGILGPKTVLAHCCWLTPTEIDILAKTGTGIAHCPVSNMKLASGVSPVVDCLEKGVKVGLGTDGIKENNNMDLFEEMKFASLLQKVHRLDATVMPAEETLKLATIYGARTLGLGDQIGSLEPGKKADIILVTLRRPHLSPKILGKYENIVPNLVFSANGSDVDTVLVDGKILLENRSLQTGDEDEIIDRANLAIMELIERREPHVPDEVSINNIEV